MIIGCLSGSGRGEAIAGTYSFCIPGRTEPLAPDLRGDLRDGAGPFPFAEGALTSGAPGCELSWRSGSVGEVGVEIVISLGGSYFVDRVIVHQLSERSSTPRTAGAAVGAAAIASGNIESVGHVEPSGLSRVELYASAPRGDGANRAPLLVGHAGERGPAAFPGGPIGVSAGVEAEELFVRLISYQRDIALAGLEVWGAAAGEPSVFPVPVEMGFLPGDPLTLDHEFSILLGPSAGDDAEFAAGLLASKLEERYELRLAVLRDEAVGSPLALALIRSGVRGGVEAVVSDLPEAPESYSLRLDAEGACLASRDRRGLVYAVETILQLLCEGNGAPSAPACRITDSPRLEFRGAHLFLPAREEIGYFRRLVRYLLVPMRINTIFLELAGAMRFDRRPEIAEAWERQNRLAAEGKAPKVPHGEVCLGGTLTKAEVKELIAYARSYGIEVIPEIQTLSHVQYLTMTYPEIAEAPAPSGYPDSYCPLNPESRRIVFDMIDEVLEVAGPVRYLHLGHDEVYTMVECPRCRGKARDELFAHDVNEIHAYLAAKGVGMMIWADMLQSWQHYAGEHAEAMIPKDIVMLEFVWYFRTWADTEDHLLENGFRVIFGNCYSSHFTRYEGRTTKPGVIGAEVSVWHATSEEAMGRLGKLYDIAYSANLAWTTRCHEELRWTYDRRIAELLPRIRSELRGLPSASPRVAPAGAKAIDLTRFVTAPRREASGGFGGYDLSGLPVGRYAWGGFPFDLADGVILVCPKGARASRGSLPTSVTVPVGAKAGSICFVHSAAGIGRIRDPFGERQVIARYVIELADSSTVTQEVAFGHHVAEWNRRHGEPMGARFHRHAGYVATWPADPLWQGKTPRGDDVTVYALTWDNPRPEVVVRAVRIEAVDADAPVALMVAGMTILG